MRHHSFDAAIKADRNRKREADVARARVAPIIGMDAASRMDHAHSLYREAIQALGYQTAGISSEGMGPMFEMAMQIGARQHRASSTAPIAQDAAPASDSPLAGASARRKA